MPPSIKLHQINIFYRQKRKAWTRSWETSKNKGQVENHPLCEESLETLIPLGHWRGLLRISKLVRGAWQAEWQACCNGQLTREFFPTVQSETVLHRNQLYRQVAQILSGHSFLKEHQFRFNFTTSPKCDCGAVSESVTHFLFQCPLFSTQRRAFHTSCSSEDGHWPRPLASIPAYPNIWKAFIAFIRSSKRLRR